MKGNHPTSPDRVKAAALLKERVGRDKLIEGWIEGPIAEAADLRGLNTLMLDLTDEPAFVRGLFSFVVEMELQFARAKRGPATRTACSVARRWRSRRTRR